ncbi:MAG TPA: LCP family protein [Ilumatobacteraceae bacterium]|nr:LCP family protein [Ilumatobacteraceae bacterium]
MSDPNEPDTTASDPTPDPPPVVVTVAVPPPPTPPKPSEPPKSATRIPRTWPQRLTIVAVFVMAIGSFGAAGALYAGQRVVEDRNIAPAIVDPSQSDAIQAAESGTGDEIGEAGEAEAGDPDAPPETFPRVEPDAKNFLITGADNNSCIDPDSPYAPAFGDRSNLGERSDTIMMWRVNPSTSQVAVLSFPRDLFVDIAGTSRKGRINEAYERDNPQKLIDTIYQNFGINTDHFVQVDFCAFRTLVNAVDGVAVPFATPVRDPNTGLNVPAAGCFTFDGDHALAYARSRKLQYLDENGEWQQDPTSDLGRISRQQDFLRRTVTRLLSKGAYNPDVAGGLIETLSEYIVADPNLTPRKMLEFAGVLSGVDPTAITTYQINADPRTVQGNAVLVPSLNGDNMQAILAIFRGEATLSGAPIQVIEPGSTTTAVPTVEQPSPTDDDAGSTVPATTLPRVQADENLFGVVPDKNISC